MELAQRFRSTKSYLSYLRSAVLIFIHNYWRIGLRIGIVLVVLVFVAGLGFLAGKSNPFYALVVACLPILIVAVEEVLKRPELTPVIILSTAAFVRISIPTGTGSRLVMSLAVTTAFTALWVLKMLQEKRFHTYPTPINRPLWGLIIVTIISLVWSNLFRDPWVVIWRSFPIVQIASTIVMVMLPMAFFLTANLIRKEQTLKILVAIMLLAGFLGLFRQYGYLSIPVNVNGLYTMWIISLSTALALFNRQLSRWQRGLLLALAGLWIFWGLGLHVSWLAGWLPGVIAVGVLIFTRSKRWTFILVIAVLVYVSINASYFLGTVIQSESRESGETRLAAWEMNWRITSQHLLFGTGPAGYAAYYLSYFPMEATASHSNYIDIIAQTGVIGLALCLWFFFGLVWYGYRLTLRLRGRGDFFEGLASAAFAGTIGCIVMMGFGDWLFPFAYTQSIAGFDYAVYNWIFMGTLLAIDRLTKEHTDTHA